MSHVDIYRYRIHFATRKSLAYISVLELGTLWERTLRRAGAPLRYSQGYNPRPKIRFPAPLPVGCGGEAEFVDVLFDAPREPTEIRAALVGATPPDLAVHDVEAVAYRAPAPDQQLVATEYRTWLRGVAPATVEAAATALMASEEVLVKKRGGSRRGKLYNFRPLVYDLRVETPPEPWDSGLWMHLSARHGATGRPDTLLRALELADLPRRCTRLRLILEEEVEKV